MFSAANLTPTRATATRVGERAASEEAGGIDKRRWTSFLTWAFVLAEMAGRDALLPNAAHAAEDAAGTSTHGGADTVPIANQLPNVNVSTATEAPEPITYQHAPTMPEYVSAPAQSELTEAKVVPAAELGSALLAGGHGGGGYAPDGASDVAGEGSAQQGLEQPFVALGHDGALLDLGLHLDLSDTVSNILGGAADGLGSLPLVGGLLHGVTDALGTTAGNIVSALEPVVSLVGLGQGDGSGYGNDLGLPGQLLFGSSGEPSAAGELVSPVGSYTTYGIALSVGSSLGSLQADVSDSSALDVHASDHLAGVDVHVGSDALHLDQAILRTAADVLA